MTSANKIGHRNANCRVPLRFRILRVVPRGEASEHVTNMTGQKTEVSKEQEEQITIDTKCKFSPGEEEHLQGIFTISCLITGLRKVIIGKIYIAA